MKNKNQKVLVGAALAVLLVAIGYFSAGSGSMFQGKFKLWQANDKPALKFNVPVSNNASGDLNDGQAEEVAARAVCQDLYNSVVSGNPDEWNEIEASNDNLVWRDCLTSYPDIFYTEDSRRVCSKVGDMFRRGDFSPPADRVSLAVVKGCRIAYPVGPFYTEHCSEFVDRYSLDEIQENPFLMEIAKSCKANNPDGYRGGQISESYCSYVRLRYSLADISASSSLNRVADLCRERHSRAWDHFVDESECQNLRLRYGDESFANDEFGVANSMDYCRRVHGFEFGPGNDLYTLENCRNLFASYDAEWIAVSEWLSMFAAKCDYHQPNARN